MAKLSEAQARVLRRMDAGEALVERHHDAYKTTVRLGNGAVDGRTVFTLERRGLIKAHVSQVDKEIAVFTYALTDAGRAAIAEVTP